MSLGAPLSRYWIEYKYMGNTSASFSCENKFVFVDDHIFPTMDVLTQKLKYLAPAPSGAPGRGGGGGVGGGGEGGGG